MVSGDEIAETVPPMCCYTGDPAGSGLGANVAQRAVGSAVGFDLIDKVTGQTDGCRVELFG